ncbi:MAG: hypothetical protein V2A79_16405 [Planctomycetota bacterium]
MLGMLIPLLLGMGLTFWDKTQPKNNAAVPTQANSTSPQVTQALSATRKRLAKLGGRQSTLLTGGLMGNPSLLRQGLKG